MHPSRAPKRSRSSCISYSLIDADFDQLLDFPKRSASRAKEVVSFSLLPCLHFLHSLGKVCLPLDEVRTQRFLQSSPTTDEGSLFFDWHALRRHPSRTACIRRYPLLLLIMLIVYGVTSVRNPKIVPWRFVGAIGTNVVDPTEMSKGNLGTRAQEAAAHARYRSRRTIHSYVNGETLYF